MVQDGADDQLGLLVGKSGSQDDVYRNFPTAGVKVDQILFVFLDLLDAKINVIASFGDFIGLQWLDLLQIEYFQRVDLSSTHFWDRISAIVDH